MTQAEKVQAIEVLADVARLIQGFTPEQRAAADMPHPKMVYRLMGRVMESLEKDLQE
jgi:hypothetical protein